MIKVKDNVWINYEWLDPCVGYVGSKMRTLDAAIKCTKDYYVVGS